MASYRLKGVIQWVSEFKLHLNVMLVLASGVNDFKLTNNAEGEGGLREPVGLAVLEEISVRVG
ncbi:hypothetical protein SABIM44S_01108 [Streptomyces abikoensis]